MKDTDNIARATPSADVIVIGGGVIGLACAWRAAQRGLRVKVLERDAPGSGASGVAAGMIAPAAEATWGEEELLEPALRSAASWEGFAGELEEASGRKVDYRRCGALHLALDRDEAEELKRRHRLQVSLGLEAEWLRAGECRALEPGLAPGVLGGVHAEYEAIVDPGAVVSALLAALDRAGAELVTGTEVVEAVVEGGRLAGVRTLDGAEHRGGDFVLAAGSWSGAGWVPEAARPAVRPVKGQIVTLRGSAEEPVCERIVATKWVYLAPRADGRVVVGATVEEMGFDTTVTAGGVHELLREAYRVLPDVAELELERASAGLRPGTPDNKPLIGRSGLDGLVLATGHWRHGVMLAPLTADAVADALSGDAVGVR